MSATVRDITVQAAADRAGDLAVLARETVLSEIHHRVGSNLQITSSILGLEANAAGPGPARDALEAVNARVRAMGLVHERLHKSNALNRVDFAVYLRDLTTDVLSVHGRGSGVEPRFDLSPFDVDVGSAIHLGLMVNELLSNSLKHAFPEGRRGIVRVSCAPLADGRFRVLVGDNGVGMPLAFDLSNSTRQGLGLVHTLAGQLGADAQFLRHDGTECRITLPSIFGSADA
ncbi:MAG: sensor histidine kinase [Thermoplasmatota archaeon]